MTTFDPADEYGVSESTKNGQLAIVAVLIFAGLTALLGALLWVAFSLSAATDGDASARQAATEAQVTANIQRVGTVNVAQTQAAAAEAAPAAPSEEPAVAQEDAASAEAPAADEAAPVAETPQAEAPVAAAAVDAGEATYKQSCQVCHAAGLLGAPKLGDKADWAPRIAQGEATLFKHAIEGFTGTKGVMPPKGGSTASDDDVKAAVRYMMAAAK